MSSTRGLLAVSFAVLVGGCAAPQRRMAADNHRLSVEVAELRAQTRKDRRQLRELEHRLLLTGPAGAREPVVVQEAPSATIDAAPAPPAIDPPTGEAMTTIGQDDDGVEVIYEGEAAEPVVRRPRLSLRERGDRPDDRPDDRGPAKRSAPVIARGDGVLPVTRGAVPTVDAQLRRARSAPGRTRPPASVDPEKEYQRYYSALSAGNHAYAVTGFRNYVARFPDHDLADNAQYWLGEGYYDQQDYVHAAIEFRRVLERYPRGNKVADALLKLGYCHAALGKLDDARATLRLVVERYPDSAPAARASERLTALGRTP